MPPELMYSFGPFQVDVASGRLKRDGHAVPLGDRPFRVLVHLASHPRTTVAKDALVAAGWGDVAVTDNSLEQAISGLRRILGSTPEGQPYIETVPRQGYRLNAPVARLVARKSADELDALLAPHRAWIDGRAALESLERQQVARAQAVFEQVVGSMPDHAPAHVGLANACVLQYEGTRADAEPATDSLTRAVHHAREACRLDTDYAEAWATLGFVLERTGNHADALAAGRRAIALEPDNWRHHLRLSSLAWGEERLRAARRTLALLPGCPLARWLAATVLVARHCLADADRELTSGIGDIDGAASLRFSGVALHWLRGLVHLAGGDVASAMTDFEAELSAELRGHLYARECCANTWYAIGVIRMRQGRLQDATAAFEEAVHRVARHPMAHVALAAMRERPDEVSSRHGDAAETRSFEAVLAAAAHRALRGDHEGAARMVETALSTAPEGNAGWLLPVEPLLNVAARPDVWAGALTRLSSRAA